MNKSFLLTENIPSHLYAHIVDQDSSRYSLADHLTWKKILNRSKEYLSINAHEKYLDGLALTGIPNDRIPNISEMDFLLRKFNWRAVPVRGFIPPATFMEFLSLGILPIACDIRPPDQLEYTPAPDIVHEAAGHAPLISDGEYSKYLRSYGEIARKAISSIQDDEVYNAIRSLSDLMVKQDSSEKDLQSAQLRLDTAVASQTTVSEASMLSRMGWWTFEYGLIGDLKNPKIYGAGLLSSLLESRRALSSAVKKIPFSVDCVEFGYDITQPQPQLFVTPDFDTLREALDQLSNQMSFRKGGEFGLRRALSAGTVCTVELETGLQISGKITDFQIDSRGLLTYLATEGMTQIAVKEREIQSSGFHSEGLQLFMNTESGNDRVNRPLAKPLATGKVVSVFGGAADRERFILKSNA